MKRKFWRVDIERGERIPAGFGTAWLAPDRDVVVCYWLGVNVAAAWLRRVYIYVKNPMFSMTGDELQRLSRLEREVKNLIGDGR